jgi:D-alanine-D-alanine ligase
MIATWEQVSLCREADLPAGMTETSSAPEPARLAGTTFDELVQWMVQDASPDRCDRWGPKLI